MNRALAVFGAIALVIAGIGLGPRLRQWRRDRLKQRPFPPLWEALVEQYVPVYPRLTPLERQQLRGLIQVFLAEKQFIGCGGLAVTLEMRVAIAAIACLLLLNGRESYFSRLRSILVYPDVYVVQETKATAPYIVEERQVARLGESWSRDQVVLAWAQIQRDRTNWRDGQNVVLHEFAHQLDQEDGEAEGVPFLKNRTDYQIWARVMAAGYEGLCRDVGRGTKTVFNPYGATNPAEFFAVATETFFEKPRQLQKRYPELYDQLRRYYQLDPIAWV